MGTLGSFSTKPEDAPKVKKTITITLPKLPDGTTYVTREMALQYPEVLRFILMVRLTCEVDYVLDIIKRTGKARYDTVTLEVEIAV